MSLTLEAWLRLMQQYRVPEANAKPVFEVLAAAYGSPNRHYHNLEHLDEMFRTVERLATFADDLQAVHLAIWFHDAVYDTRAKDNESRSADLAVKLLEPIGVLRSELEIATRLILATAHLANPLPCVDRPTALLLDADLAILGAAPHRYFRYAADIRAEYQWVPDADYRAGRCKVLEAFLARPRIFQTNAMHAEFDEHARTNLKAEFENLQANLPV